MSEVTVSPLTYERLRHIAQIRGCTISDALEDAIREFDLARDCRLCGGVGAIDGFLLGTVKTCPSCHGGGRQ